MDKVREGKYPYIKDYYTSKMSIRNFSSYSCKSEREHTLTGGIVIVKRPNLVLGRIFMIPEVFSDRCSCPVPIEEKCTKVLPIVLFNN